MAETHRGGEVTSLPLSTGHATQESVAQTLDFDAVYAEFFAKPYPVRATVVVKELLAEGLRIEITATAVLANAGLASP